MVFPGLPALPAGFAVRASLRAPADPVGGGYVLRGHSGGSRDALWPDLDSVVVEDGKASVRIGDGAHGLQLWVECHDRRVRSIVQQSPAEVFAGFGPIEVRVSAEKLLQLVAELRKPVPATGR